MTANTSRHALSFPVRWLCIYMYQTCNVVGFEMSVSTSVEGNKAYLSEVWSDSSGKH